MRVVIVNGDGEGARVVMVSGEREGEWRGQLVNVSLSKCVRKSIFFSVSVSEWRRFAEVCSPPSSSSGFCF